MTFCKTTFLCYLFAVKLRDMAKSDQLSTIHRQQRMLKALSAHYGIVTRAAKAAGITPQTHYNWYRGDEQYAEQVNLIKYECHENFKNLVMDAVIKKVNEGNTTIIAMCYKSLFKDLPERMERGSPFRARPKVAIRVQSKPIEYAKDPMTQEAVREYEERLLEQRRQPPNS